MRTHARTHAGTYARTHTHTFTRSHTHTRTPCAHRHTCTLTEAHRLTGAVFGDIPNLSDSQLTLSQNGNPVCLEADAWRASPALQPSQERVLDRLIATLTDALQNNQISNITTSSMMELFSYKTKCLEQRLHSQSMALKGATEHVATLEHTLAMSQAAVTSQQDILYTVQVQNERYRKTVEDLHKQLEDAETTLRGFRAKLAAERVNRDNQIAAAKQETLAQIARMDSEMKAHEKEMEARLARVQEEVQTVQSNLDQQTKKNSELAGVLVKFEERVKQRDRRLEEAAAADAAQRRDLEHKDATIKQLEKTVLERENRLYQVTTQLEEMKRVQEMVAKLMSKSTAGVNGSTS
ncbi:hypothetical protein EVAR_4265_1 [Eumeta japonica]|uniref:Uncharacterized protein n=1 Tax=Eumeta variegata TaxID=151549 RepID=A0A4C1Z4N3_EUMVA|nr:hypothetical protein EVAR_4265_1 [Eumeta japonica]